MNNFRKEKTLWKVKFNISELLIQCNKDSCYELITVEVNIYFSVTIKTLNCEILTKNLVTFKRWDGVKDEKLWGFTKKSRF